MSTRNIRAILNCAVMFRKDKKLVDIEVRNNRILSIRQHAEGGRSGKYDFFDANGFLVIPSFIDCHAHLFSLALHEESVHLEGSASIGEMQRRISEFGRKKKSSKDWLAGRGWDQDKFSEKRMPDRHDIDFACADMPAIMTRVCGHIAVLNSFAIEKLSEILRKFGKELVPLDESGNPTGIVKEGALASCLESIPKLSQPELERLFLDVQSKCLQYGLSGVHCILSENWEEELSVLRHLRKKLVLKLSILLPASAIDFVESLNQSHRSSFLKRSGRVLVIGFKLYSDGSLGARTAALERPYSDDTPNSGILYYNTDEIASYARRVKRLGLILACHAIGDRAIAQVLEAYKLAGINKRDGFRIEHFSVVSKKLLKLAGIATICVQPMFVKSDYWVRDRLGNTGERFAYPFRSMYKLTTLLGGSDSPVESIDPLESIKAAMKNGKESLNFEDSLSLYTCNAAPSSPLTRDSGKIARGRKCDLVILNCKTEREIGMAKVQALFIEGKAVVVS